MQKAASTPSLSTSSCQCRSVHSLRYPSSQRVRRTVRCIFISHSNASEASVVPQVAAVPGLMASLWAVLLAERTQARSHLLPAYTALFRLVNSGTWCEHTGLISHSGIVDCHALSGVDSVVAMAFSDLGSALQRGEAVVAREICKFLAAFAHGVIGTRFCACHSLVRSGSAGRDSGIAPSAPGALR